MDAIASRRRTWAGRLRGTIAALAVGCLVAGCTAAAASPSLTATPQSSPEASAPAQPSAGPTTTPTPTTPSNVGTAPAGKWTGIRWIAAGPVFPQTPVPDGGDGSSVQINVSGWSRGYVGFRTASSWDLSGTEPTESWATVSTVSADGLHWTPGKAFDAGDVNSRVYMSGVVEGPAGLLAVGRNPAATCGGPPTVRALWTSPDGQTWTRVSLPADFASARVYTVDAGSAGYIATGTLEDDVTPAVWVSADGRSWRPTTLPKPSSGVVVDGATSFAGGYVISGSHPFEIGCGESLYVPSLWWSADGTGWTAASRPEQCLRIPLRDGRPDQRPRPDGHRAAVGREDAGRFAAGLGQRRRSHLEPDQVPSSLLSDRILTNGQRGLVVVPALNGGPPTIATVDDDLTVTTLSQSGEGPVDSDESSPWISALGPTGLVILSVDGLNLWLGVPEA